MFVNINNQLLDNFQLINNGLVLLDDIHHHKEPYKSNMK